jgi:protein-L-isoaspartate(D-aspartate) O-methyltransferase
MNEKLKTTLLAAALAVFFLAAGVMIFSNSAAPLPPNASQAASGGAASKIQDEETTFAEQRRLMVEHQLRARGISDDHALTAMETVPRHEFVPESIRGYAYADTALPIGREQTISQPFIVALMTQLAVVRPDDVVLEVGTGSGYQAAVLAEITKSVYSIEIDCVLADEAAARLKRLGYAGVTVKCGDGYEGWPEHAPFDAILVTAAAPCVPEPLLEQLKVGGVMVIPEGGEDELQILKTYTRTKGGFEERSINLVRFVPMTGKVQETKKPN